MELTSWIFILAVVVILVMLYVRYMSATHDTFNKMGIDGPSPSWLTGNLGETSKHGVFDVQIKLYNEYRDKKVYGLYDGRNPVLVIKDLDMIKDVMVRNFSQFTDRRQFMDNPQPPMSDTLLLLTGDRWKRVRSAVSPTFSSGRIKNMSTHVEKNIQLLLKELRAKHERNEDVDLSAAAYSFTLNVIASAVFGMDFNSFEDPKHKFCTESQKMVGGSPLLIISRMLFPPLAKVLSKFGFQYVPQDSLRYFIQILDAAIAERRDGQTAGKIKDFLDLVINAETEPGQEGARQLSRSEIHGQAVVFFLAAYGSVATVLSFTLFLLAKHPECCRKVQEEIDRQLGKDAPNYDNVQHLAYLEMVINESMRMFPPGFITDRVSVEETVIGGVRIPKGMTVMMPLFAIHHDPDIWEEPRKFNPERFSPENKAARHPFAHLPFGQGPRNCIGMRLALMELKMTITSILQQFELAPCSKTIYPPKLMKFQVKAEDGLWVKMESRK